MHVVSEVYECQHVCEQNRNNEKYIGGNDTGYFFYHFTKLCHTERLCLPRHYRTAIKKHPAIVRRRVGHGALYGSYFHFSRHFKYWWKWQALYFFLFTSCQFAKLRMRGQDMYVAHTGDVEIIT